MTGKIFLHQIRAGHDFNEIVARRAFTDKNVGREWSINFRELKKAQAETEDESFDAWCFWDDVSEIDLDNEEMA